MKNLTASQHKSLVDNFVYRFQARATITNKVYRSYERPKFDPNNFTQDFKIAIHDQPVVELEIPLEEFHKLAEQVHDLEDLRVRFGHRIEEVGERIIAREWQDSRERQLRDSTPAVKKAWENYQLMLKIAGG
jgi:predicted transcriptional regulator